MNIRPEAEADHQAIRTINIEAFKIHPYSHQTEHLIVEALRAEGALTLSLVAEIDGRVLGHIAFSAVKIGGADCRWFTLGPVAVLPGFQKQGIGKGLVLEGLKRLRALGAHGCILVGDPGYYKRFGFGPCPALTMAGVPQQFILGLSMNPRAAKGEVSLHAAFFVHE